MEICFHFHGVSNAVHNDQVHIHFRYLTSGALHLFRAAVGRGGNGGNLGNVIFPFILRLRHLLGRGGDDGDLAAAGQSRHHAVENLAE